MNKNIKILTGLAICSFLFSTITSCIDETEPTSGLTQEQVDASDNAISSMLMAMPARFNQFDARTGNFGDYAFGYGGIMHIRDVQTEDMAIPESNYDHFYPWEVNKGMGESTARTQYLWNFNWQSILAANKLIKAIPDEENASTFDLAAKGAAYAFRALYYIDMARCFEFLPNDIYSGKNQDGNDVTNLTVPIVDENSTEESVKNNPRATREQMFEFIKQDLDNAERLIVNLDKFTDYKRGKDYTLPHIDAVYGLKARLYMWVEDYQNALTYAQKAIQNATEASLTTFDDCFELVQEGESAYLVPTKTCFNTISKWMWGVAQTSENRTVTSGIMNWTSWMTPECTFGYANAGCPPCIYLPLLARTDADDWRYYFWDEEDPAAPGVSQKFQPNQGEFKNSKVAAATPYPIMRLEEMYFIVAEAMAQLQPAQGKAFLIQFMQKYRSVNANVLGKTATYTCNATSKEDIIEEIIFQKRIELWGEGQSFFDIKRLNYSVDRTQPGSNFQSLARLKTKGRPAWMNWVIVLTEQNNNKGLVGWNNPDPTDKYNVVPED